MRLVRIRQTSTTTDIPIIFTTTQITLIQLCCHVNNHVRCWNMDYHQKTRINASHYPAQNAPNHHPDKKKIQKEKFWETDIRDDCEGGVDVIGVVTPLVRGVAQVLHGDQVVELSVQLEVQEVEGKEERQGRTGRSRR